VAASRAAQAPTRSLPSAEDIAVTHHQYIIADEESGRTSKDGVYAGGDIVTGAAMVISALGAGRKAAKAIHEHVMSRPAKTPTPA